MILPKGVFLRSILIKGPLNYLMKDLSLLSHTSTCDFHTLCYYAFLDFASIFFGIFWENEHFFSFFLEKELLAFSVIFHDCDLDFSTQKTFSSC